MSFPSTREINGLLFTYTPFPNVFSEECFEDLYFKVFDGVALSDNEFQLVITIFAVNDAPTIDSITDKIIDEGAFFRSTSFHF